MKQKVVDFFTNFPSKAEAQFNEALSLYQKSQGHNAQSLRFFNSSGFSKINLANLLYDLKQLHGITDAHVRALKTKPKKVVKTIPEITLENLDTISPDVLLEFLKSKNVTIPNAPEDYHQLKAFIKDHEIETPSQSKEDLLAAFNNWLPGFIREVYRKTLMSSKITSAVYDMNSAGKAIVGKVGDVIEIPQTKEQVFTEAPDEVKETIKLKDQFPFLKDPETCPEEFYILVGHKFAHYDAYIAACKELLVVVDPEASEDKAPTPLAPEQITELALAAVENFQINQDIYDELAHYDEHKKILGAHPIFIERKLKESVESLNAGTVGKRISNLENYIRRDNRNADKAEKEKNLEEQKKYTDKVKGWEIELRMIKTKFNIKDDEK